MHDTEKLKSINVKQVRGAVQRCGFLKLAFCYSKQD